MTLAFEYLVLKLVLPLRNCVAKACYLTFLSLCKMKPIIAPNSGALSAVFNELIKAVKLKLWKMILQKGPWYPCLDSQ